MASLTDILNNMFSAMDQAPFYCDHREKLPCQRNGKAIGYCKEVGCRHLKRRDNVRILRQSKYALRPKNLTVIMAMGL